jgi:hypothetical protein
MTPEQLAARVDALAHANLADLLNAGAGPPAAEVVGRAVSKCGRLKVVISLTRYDGPARLSPGTLDRIREFEKRERLAGLSPCQRQILSACHPDKPLTTYQIARRCGRKPNSYFRGQLAALARDPLGLLAAKDGGYVRSNSD